MIRKVGPIFLINLCSLLMGLVWDAFLWRLVCRVVSFSIVFRERARSFSWVGRLGGSSVLVIGGVWFGRGAELECSQLELSDWNAKCRAFFWCIA